MSISTYIAQWRPDDGPAGVTPRSCRPREQGAEPDQVIGCRRKGQDPVDQLAATMPQLAQPTDRLHPAEDLLDQFPFALTDRIARMTGGALVDARADILLRDMRRNPQLAGRR